MTIMWKPIKNYDGLYEVSNHGQVRSLYDWRKHSLRQEPKLLKPFMTNVLCVDLYDCMHDKSTTSIARLVASYFIPNPCNYRFVLHKDGNHYNNSVDNLFWSSKSVRTLNNCTPVKCIQNNTIYTSMKACEQALGLTQGTISRYFRLNQRYVQGYSFERIITCQKNGNQ